MSHSIDLLDERSDHWRVAQGGVEIIRLAVDYAVTFIMKSDSGAIEIRIGAPFLLTDPNGNEQLLVPEGDPTQLGPVLSLLHRSADYVAAFKDGHLEVLFDDGTRVSIPPEEGLEAWELSGPMGLRLVSIPGGEVAVWLPSSD